MTFSQFVVEFLEVIVHHTLGREARSDLRYGVLDILYPLRAITLTVTSVIQRNNLRLQHLIDGSSIQLVLVRLVLIRTMFGQGPTCTFYVTFVPPTVLHREVQHTVHLRFLAGCTGSLKRTGRRIQPDIHTTHQTFSQTHIVVLQEDNLTEELRHTTNLNNTLNQALSSAICRVSLTREQELNRIIRVVNQLIQALQVRKQQVSTFIRRKTTAETDNQSLGIHLIERAHNTSRITLTLHPILTELHLDIVNQLLFQNHTRRPNLLVRNVVVGLPHIEVRLVLPPTLRELRVIHFFPFRRGPSRHMHTVRYIVHMQLFREIARPNRCEHLLRHFTVQPRYTIRFLTGVKRKHRHREFLSLVIRIRTTQTNQVIPFNTQLLRILTHILVEQAFLKIVVTGRNWRMAGVQTTRTNNLLCLIKR